MNPELISLTKLFISFLGVAGTFVAAHHNIQQTKKTRMELLKELDASVQAENKNTSSEIFQMLYGFRYPFSKIKSLLTDDDVNYKIYLLRKKGDAIKYENDKFIFTDRYQKKWVRFVDKYINQTMAWVSGLSIVPLLIIISLFKSIEVFVMGFVLVIVFTVVFTYSLQQVSFIKGVNEVIDKL